MKIVLKGFKVNQEINYKIVSIDKCCDKILCNPVVNINKLPSDNYQYNNIAVTLTETNIYHDSWEECPDISEEYHPITYCPFCSEKIEIIIDEIIDVTEDYNAVHKEANVYCNKANRCDSRKREAELRQQEYQISKLLNWWLTTESLHSICDDEY